MNCLILLSKDEKPPVLVVLVVFVFPWGLEHPALYQERAVFGKMKMDPAKRAQTQIAGEVSLLQWFFSQSVELMMDKVLLHCIRPMLLK
jgi:hypothetical protein